MKHSHIGPDSVVPLGWVMGGFASVIASVILATVWVVSVNDRLGRIEEKLGIKTEASLTIFAMKE